MSLNNENKNFSQNESEKTNSQYISSKDNIDNLNELRNNLKGKNKYIDKYHNVLTNYELDNKNIKLCYENEENMNKYLEKNLLKKMMPLN